MGYTTDFYGTFKLDKPLDPLHSEYLKMFSDTRRMKRDFNKLSMMKAIGKGNRRCFALLDELHLGLGISGDFYCGTGMCGQDGGHFNNVNDDSVVDYNSPANGQPGLWCHWVPNDSGTEIVWDGGEKFYDYVEWITFIVGTFLKPWGYKLNGIVEWQGEDRDDTGVIQIVDNGIITHAGKRRNDFKEIPKATKPVSVAITAMPNGDIKATVSNTPEIIMDLIKLRNDLATSKKGTAVACKKLDELIKKYGV